LGFTTVADGRYQNSPEASTFLVKGKPQYLGAMAEVMMDQMETWRKMPESARTGQPASQETTDVEDNPFWHVLVPAIAALALPVAQGAADRLGIARATEPSWLDVGGGSGVWSAVWLKTNPKGHGFQLDWPTVNKIAREFVTKFGVNAGFETIDGDFHTVD